MNCPRLVPLFVAFTFGLAALGADGADADSLDTIQKTAVEWTRVRIETQKLRADWASERTMLQSALTGLKERLAALQQRREAVEAETAGARAEIDSLKTRNAAVTSSLADAEVRIEALGTELVRIRPWLPPRLSNALELPFRTLAEAERSPGERMQVMVAMLGRCVQFNRTVTFSEEVLAGPGVEPDRVCEVVYWGMAEAYALDRSRGRAFLGHPGASGWVWEQRDDAVESVSRLIANYRNPSEPAFATVPAQITAVPAAVAAP